MTTNLQKQFNQSIHQSSSSLSFCINIYIIIYKTIIADDNKSRVVGVPFFPPAQPLVSQEAEIKVFFCF